MPSREQVLLGRVPKSLSHSTKKGMVAVMCYTEGRHFWFHIYEKEFREVFSETML